MPDWKQKPKDNWELVCFFAEKAWKWVVEFREGVAMNKADREIYEELGLSLSEVRRIGAVTVAELRDNAPEDMEGKVSPNEAWQSGFLAGALYERANTHATDLHKERPA